MRTCFQDRVIYIFIIYITSSSSVFLLTYTTDKTYQYMQVSNVGQIIPSPFLEVMQSATKTKCKFARGVCLQQEIPIISRRFTVVLDKLPS